ncbi:MAG: DUF4911 domain-containing protein [Bdellovibrionota bacterium]
MTESINLTDRRLYLWIKHEDIVFFQSNLEAEDGLARIRTEKQTDSESLIVMLFMASREKEVLSVIEHLQEAGIEIRFDVAR